MKKFYAYLTFTIIFSILFATSSFAISGRTSATVVEIIDGDAIKVRTEDNEVAFVKLLGINATGSDEAFQYLHSVLLGQKVDLAFDSEAPQTSGRWYLMNVTLNKNLINTDLAKKGMAVADTKQNKVSNYAKIVEGESYARHHNLGMWAYASRSASSITGSGININTATATQLSNQLTGVDSALAAQIVSYRGKNPFNNMFEIKFVDGVTKKIFDDNRSLLSVYTNINSASESEIRTLASVTTGMAKGIADYRNIYLLSDTKALLDSELMAISIYNRNLPYMGINDMHEIQVAFPKTVVNINTADAAQVESAGITGSHAKSIVRYRQNYSYKTVGEIAALPGINITEKRMNELEDNFTVRTNINTATIEELQSLFGSEANAAELAQSIYNNRSYSRITDVQLYIPEAEFERIEPYIYVGDYLRPDYTNINLASEQDIVELGLSPSNAAKLSSEFKRMKNSDRIPLNLSDFDEKIALYTNINKASLNELLSLHRNMTPTLANSIINYRDDQPFGSSEEVSDFFKDEDARVVYDDIKEFIVLY